MGGPLVEKSLALGIGAFADVGARGGRLAGGFFVGGDGEGLIFELIVAHGGTG